jgi:hypothetical protein
MKQITAIGAGFHTHLSTNSDLLPKKFRWTRQETDTLVFIDRAIGEGIHYKKKTDQKKVGWVCESRAIFYEWGIPKELFWDKSVINLLEENYDAIFFSDREYSKLSPKFHFAFAGSNLPWCKNQQIFSKSKLVSMIASSKKMTVGHHLRHEYAEKFKDKLDLFGGAAGSKPIGGNSSPWPDKSEAINEYMFHITLENDSYSTYFTEKVTDCFATGTIPIYWGAPDIGDYFNKDGIIFLDKSFDINTLTPELYASKIEAIKDNFERVQRLESSDDQLYDLIQRI